MLHSRRIPGFGSGPPRPDGPSKETEAMQIPLDGATRVHYIVGDPIAQVKSPGGVTADFHQAGLNAVVVPAHVVPADLAAWAAGVSLARNVDGIIVTVPHKFAFHALCATASERATFLGAVNTLRRNADGSWHGDMFDGLGYVRAMALKGCDVAGRRVLLVGAGGAGSAIAHAVVMAGAAQLVIHDESDSRRDTLVARLAVLGRGEVLASRTGRPAAAGFDIALNATPMGMQAGDPLPFSLEGAGADTFVGCVVTQPSVPPVIAQARALGCETSTGADMFAQVRELMVAFLRGQDTP